MSGTKETKPEVTGQLMTRPAGMEAPDGSNRQLVMVFGVLAIGEDSELLQEGAQFTVMGQDLGGLGTRLVMLPGPVDRSELSKGLAPSQLLTSPIWRV